MFSRFFVRFERGDLFLCLMSFSLGRVGICFMFLSLSMFCILVWKNRFCVCFETDPHTVALVDGGLSGLGLFMVVGL